CLVNELDLAFRDDEELPGPLPLVEDPRSSRIRTPGREAAERLDVARGKRVEVVARHRRSQPRRELAAARKRVFHPARTVADPTVWSDKTASTGSLNTERSYLCRRSFPSDVQSLCP